MQQEFSCTENQIPCNKGKITGQQPPLKRNEIWAIRIRLHIRGRVRDLVLFNLAIDCKLRACDLVSLPVRDVTQSNQVPKRATAMQSKTKRPVQFEITDQTSLAIGRWLEFKGLQSQD